MFILIGIMASGCASITGTTKQNLSVQTIGPDGKEIRDAACILANSRGKWTVSSPGSVTVTPSNDALDVTCNQRGSKPGRASVLSVTNGAILGNIILGGGVGALVDYNTGAAFSYPTSIHVTMGAFTKIEMPKTYEEQRANGDGNDNSPQVRSSMASNPSPMATPRISPPGHEEASSGLPQDPDWYRTHVIPYPR